MKKYDVVAITGKYTNRDGVEKNRYLNCGAVFETDKGLSLKLEAIPMGSEGWFQLYEPRGQSAPKDQPVADRGQSFLDDDLPNFTPPSEDDSSIPF